MHFLADVTTAAAAAAAATATPTPAPAAAATAGLDAVQLLVFICLGLILGAAGQGARAIVGWKKMHDDAANNGVSMDSLFRARDMVVSFGIGSVAGILASVGLLLSSTPLDGRSIIAVLAAGYAGTDFIEGFASQWLQRTANRPVNGGNDPDASADPKDGTPAAVPVAVVLPPVDDDPNAPAALAEGLAQG